MRIVIISDLHGVDLRTFWNHLIHLRPNMLINLGDYDLPETVYQFIQIKKTLMAKGVEVIDVMGNHDHSMLNKIYISSGTLGKILSHMDKGVLQLYEEFDQQENRTAKVYLENRPVRVPLNIGGMRTLAMHGALAGHNNEDTPGDLWFRLDERSYRLNFGEMMKLNFQILIRGHDHYPRYIHWSPSRAERVYTETNSEYNLFINDAKGAGCPGCNNVIPINARICPSCGINISRFHVIMPGALYDGQFAVIDVMPPYPRLHYMKIPVRRFRLGQSILCWNCGEGVANMNQKFCQKCAKELMFCLHCMAPNPVAAKMCPHCGEKGFQHI